MGNAANSDRYLLAGLALHDGAEARRQSLDRLERLERSLLHLAPANADAERAALVVRIAAAAAARPLPVRRVGAAGDAADAALVALVPAASLVAGYDLPLAALVLIGALPLVAFVLATLGPRRRRLGAAGLLMVLTGQAMAMLTIPLMALGSPILMPAWVPPIVLMAATTWTAVTALREARLRCVDEDGARIQRAAATTRIAWACVIAALVVVG